MINDLKTGMEIMRHYSPDAPVIAAPYMIMVPAVKTADITDPTPNAVSDLTGLGWILHPVYDCYYYPAMTITELADVTEDDGPQVPALPVI